MNEFENTIQFTNQNFFSSNMNFFHRYFNFFGRVNFDYKYFGVFGKKNDGHYNIVKVTNEFDVRLFLEKFGQT